MAKPRVSAGAGDGAIEALYGDQLAKLLHQNTLFELVPISQMFREPEYARPINTHKVEHYVDTWNPLRLLVLILSMRDDGRFAIIDGSHRHAAASARGTPPVLPAQVFIDLSIEEEAEMFRAFNQDRTPATPMDIFRAAWRSGQGVSGARARNIRSICQECGFDVAVDGKGANRITAVGALQTMYTKTGPNGLEEVLRIIGEAWGTDGTMRRSTHAWVLLGLMNFWARYHESKKFNRARFVHQLQASDPEIVLGRSEKHRTIKSGITPPLAVGRVLLDHYNSGLQSAQRLPEWQDHFYPARSLVNRPQAGRKSWQTRRQNQNGGNA